MFHQQKMCSNISASSYSTSAFVFMGSGLEFRELYSLSPTFEFTPTPQEGVSVAVSEPTPLSSWFFLGDPEKGQEVADSQSSCETFTGKPTELQFRALTGTGPFLIWDLFPLFFLKDSFSITQALGPTKPRLLAACNPPWQGRLTPSHVFLPLPQLPSSRLHFPQRLSSNRCNVGRKEIPAFPALPVKHLPSIFRFPFYLRFWPWCGHSKQL